MVSVRRVVVVVVVVVGGGGGQGRANPVVLCPVVVEAADLGRVVDIELVEHVLDEVSDFDYAPQVRRFYEDRAEHNMVRPTPTAAAADDPPF